MPSQCEASSKNPIRQVLPTLIILIGGAAAAAAITASFAIQWTQALLVGANPSVLHAAIVLAISAWYIGFCAIKIRVNWRQLAEHPSGAKSGLAAAVFGALLCAALFAFHMANDLPYIT